MDEQSDRCEFCESYDALENRLVTVYRHRREQHFIFERVPARVCPACGHRYFSWDVAEEMDRLLESPESQSHLRPTPVIPVAAGQPE